MKKVCCAACILGIGVVGMMIYALNNKETKSQANKVLNDMLKETDNIIKKK